MYCKHCGNQIADDSVFCAKCGKLIVEARNTLRNETIVTSQPNETKWWTTGNLQWKRPTVAKGLQIGILIILGLVLLYLLWCFISGGKVVEYGNKYGGHHEVYVNDPWEIKILDFTAVKFISNRRNAIVGYSTFTKSDAQNVFRLRILLLLLPFSILLWLTIKWMKGTRFPGEKDIVPRDVADEIEQYEWHGFTRNKYVFYKKDGKFGVIDARNYCVNVPAQYDSIVWRMPNKTCDVTIGNEKQTITIIKTQPYDPNKKVIDSKKRTHVFWGVLLALWGTFCVVSDLIAIFDPEDKSEPGAYVFMFIMGIASLLGAFFVFKAAKK